MINKKVDEAIFDVLLEQAFSDVIEDDIKKLQEETAPCTISAETEQRIKKLITQTGKAEKRMRTKVIVRAASIVLVVLLNVSLIGLFMVPSVNAEVKNVFADLFDKYVSYENKEQDSYVVTTSEYEIGYVPKNFELITYDDYQIRFRETHGSNGYIIINISDEDFGHMSLDVEHSLTEIIKINDVDASMNKFNEEYLIFWFDGCHFISINTNLDEEELIRIAINIKKIQ